MQDIPTAQPIGDHVLSLPDGRRLAWAEWGRADGPAALLLHRSPGSRLFDPDPSATAAAGVRLLTMDRPGYGGTDPVVDPRRTDVAGDVAALAGALGLERVALLGWSGGGQFAVEAAATLGDRVRSLSLLATPAPDEEIPWVAEQFRPMAAGVRADPIAAVASIQDAVRWYPDNPDAVVAFDACAADTEVRGRLGVNAALTIMMREGAHQGGAGMAFDVVAGARGDSFRFGHVRGPVKLWYGDADPIGPEHGRWYADRLAGTTLTVLPGAGHLLPITHWTAILEAALV
jgi:pimeloyl-ACP methyl ester carboxylesterase